MISISVKIPVGMNMRQLASAVAKREGKKKQVSIGNIREVLRILVDMELEALKESDFKKSTLLPLKSAVLGKAFPQKRKAKKKNAVSRRRSR